ncbi:hypothetical protein ACJMK2_030282 [Sinanodonta woodiana]|uniref:Coiled-coil domain-containing protein 28B n=1 Tax=Sinanodonta woodiana TaxID=1069815 RepID=A0ABD3XCQ1_SINWO
MDNKLPSSDKKTYSPEKQKNDPDSALAQRPAKEHTFLTDVADVRVMEQGLLHLLEDFHSGKLEAFGGMSTYEKMDQIREQQEELAHLHFELDLQQDMRRLDSEEARKRNNANLKKLIDKVA